MCPLDFGLPRSTTPHLDGPRHPLDRTGVVWSLRPRASGRRIFTNTSHSHVTVLRSPDPLPDRPDVRLGLGPVLPRTDPTVTPYTHLGVGPCGHPRWAPGPVDLNDHETRDTRRPANLRTRSRVRSLQSRRTKGASAGLSGVRTGLHPLSRPLQ